MNVAVLGTLLFVSTTLQGCSFWGDKKKGKEVAELKDDEEEASASCMGGKFSCKGNWREWCARQEQKCTGGQGRGTNCMPQCTWKCDSAKCDQTCAPKCAQAMCATRCKGFNTNSCEMKCGKPDCKVVCPKKFCPNLNCASCKTECGKPVCKMECQDAEQNCRHVCAQPKCKWECKKPKECPKPKCEMLCAKPRQCMDNTHMVQSMPPLEPGESEVTAFQTPKIAEKSLLQGKHIHGTTATLRVEITTMRANHSLQTGQADLQLAPMDEADSAPVSWTMSAMKHNGQVFEMQASCNGGRFKCDGEAGWCTAQKDSVCSQAAEETQSETPQYQEAVKAAETKEATETLQPEEHVEVAAEAEADAEAQQAANEALQSARLAFMQHREPQGHLKA